MGGGRQPSGEGVKIEQGHERRADDEAVFPELALGEAWDESITTGRAVGLEGMLQAWEQEADHGERKGPFDTTGLADEDAQERERLRLTGADVYWLAVRTLAGAADRQAIADQIERLRQARKVDVVAVWLDLSALHLAGANLASVNLAGATLCAANLSDADLEGANLTKANLERATLCDADLGGATLTGASLASANLSDAGLLKAALAGAYLVNATCTGASLTSATLTNANLDEANLTGADLLWADLSGASLERANLSGADLFKANLTGASLEGANLSGADLTGVTFANSTDLTGVRVTDTPGRLAALVHRLRHQPTYGAPRLGYIHWNDVDVTLLDWSGLRRLGDERGKRWWWRGRWESVEATRANTQLARQLRDAGMNDDADRFAYRAQVCQRGVHLLRGHILRWLFSWLLFVIAGYGYRPLRTLFWYLAVIFAFAAVYFSVGPGVGVPLSPLGSVVFSITSFHGRGFFPGGSPGHSVTLDDPLTVMAAMEAVVGLFIEISFIATFTQRYFGK